MKATTYRERGLKAAETRRRRLRHEDYVRRGLKAAETRRRRQMEREAAEAVAAEQERRDAKVETVVERIMSVLAAETSSRPLYSSGSDAAPSHRHMIDGEPAHVKPSYQRTEVEALNEAACQPDDDEDDFDCCDLMRRAGAIRLVA